jgi:hypothetical protein
MTTPDPITPPPELVQQWRHEWNTLGARHPAATDTASYVAHRAAQWGANQELEACCALMDDWGLEASDLRAARRPKPPSLKELALADLSEIGSHYIGPGTAQRIDTIRRALENLPDD